MKKIFILVGVLIICASTSKAQSLNLDQVLENHYKAIGIDKLQEVKSIIMAGSNTTHVVMPVKFYRVRPNKYRMERDVNDITGFTVFDGQIGWTLAPWSRNPLPQVATGQTLVDIQNAADFDGAIYNWKSKGHTAELIGIEKVGDVDAYRIKLTLKSGGIEYYFIDTKNFLIQRKLNYRIIREKEVEFQFNYTDYRSVEGVMFPFTYETTAVGQQSSTIQFDTIELNQPIDEKIFVMPSK